MTAVLSNPWFQLCGLVAVMAGGISAYNEATTGAYTGVSRGTAPSATPPPVQANSTAVVAAPNSLQVATSASAPPDTSRTSATTPSPAAAPPAATAIRSPTSEGLQSVSFSDPQAGIAAASTAGVVLRTRDGGQTWVREPAGPVSNDPAQAVWRVVALPTGVAYTFANGGRIQRSAGAGTNWSAVVSDASQGLYDAAFASATVGVAVGSCGTMVRTTDGGLTWRSIPAFPAVTINCRMSKDDFRAVTFADAGVGLIASGFGGILRSNDAGATWVRQPQSGDQVFIHGVAWAGGDVWVAVGYQEGSGSRSVLLRSTDGGLSWKPGSPCSAEALYSVTFAHGVGLTTGGNGVICMSKDMGRTWGRLYRVPTAQFVHALAIVSPSEAFAVGDNGTILRFRL